MRILTASTQRIGTHLITDLLKSMLTLPKNIMPSICSHQITEDIVKLGTDKLLDLFSLNLGTLMIIAILA